MTVVASSPDRKPPPFAEARAPGDLAPPKLSRELLGLKYGYAKARSRDPWFGCGKTSRFSRDLGWVPVFAGMTAIGATDQTHRHLV